MSSYLPSCPEHTFLFASLGSKQPLTSRKVHIRRLYDILQLSIQQRHFERALRAWAILVRCKEVDWKCLWNIGLILLGGEALNNKPEREVEYLRIMMLQYPDDRETILKELIFRLLHDGKCKDALDELELYLPSFPYQDNPVLHVYAGLSSLHLAYSLSETRKSFNWALFREAQMHLERAKILDPNNTVAQTFLDKINDLTKEKQKIQDESEDENMSLDGVEPGAKRSRI